MSVQVARTSRRSPSSPPGARIRRHGIQLHGSGTLSWDLLNGCQDGALVVKGLEAELGGFARLCWAVVVGAGMVWNGVGGNGAGGNWKKELPFHLTVLV
jgi:hypothetical protein